MENKHELHEHSGHHECGNLYVELLTHFPYAVFSVALGLVGAALLDYFSFGASPATVSHGAHTLFHTFHFLHIVFASTGAMLTYLRFSKNLILGLLISSVSTVFFCILSDVLLPYVGGWLLGIHMHLHVCFLTEPENVLPFLFIGLLNGWVLAQHKQGLQSYYSLWSHFAHILVSALASLLYIISHGFSDWASFMGIIFLFMIFAVVIPCTMSDVVVPLYFAKRKS